MSKKLKIARRDRKQSLKLLYEWIKTGAITLKQFEELYPYIEVSECEACRGERGGFLVMRM